MDGVLYASVMQRHAENTAEALLGMMMFYWDWGHIGQAY